MTDGNTLLDAPRPISSDVTEDEDATLVQPRAHADVLAPSSRDRTNPDPFDAMLADPALPVDREALSVAVRDMRRWTRRYLKPLARFVSLTGVWCIIAFKRVLPFQFRAHDLIDVLCVWFMRRFVSVEAAQSLIRHFVLETNLINFVVRNSGATDIPEVPLKPRTLAEMGDNTVIKHDINIYNLVLDLGASRTADVLRRRPLQSLDFSMLDVPAIDAEPGRRRWLNLDIETALYLMNLPFCLFTTEDEYERAVNSFQLDESLLAYIANLTGDPTFRTWTPNKFMVWLGINRDVPRDLYWHAAVNEFAHTRLSQMARARERGERWPLEQEGARG